MNDRIGPSERRPRPVARTALHAVSALVLLSMACSPDAPGASDVSGPPGSDAAVTLAWDRPTTDAEGNDLGDLASFRIYVATASPVERDGAEMVEVGDTTRHTITDLEGGVYYLAVSAVDTAGNESELSDEVRAEVAGS